MVQWKYRSVRMHTMIEIKVLNFQDGEGMRLYTVVILQLIIWSGYTFVEWLSRYDILSMKVIILLIFVYFAMVLGNHLLHSKMRTVLATSISISVYLFFYFIMFYIDDLIR
ncbi:hypothetical protein P4U90_16550 [Cytobacillus kochii]|uniref:hypothetical protein n=1 Tax=Cytobacillus kochii TaxID=859143 RepID=UPI002E1AD614|nr:hypothetical protein [Cytobacillus kochii]